MSEPDVRVSYGVKELLNRIDVRLEIIVNKLDSKADLRDVIDLRDRLTKIEKRWDESMAVDAELKQRSSATFTRREKILTLFFAAVTVLIQYIHPYFH